MSSKKQLFVYVLSAMMLCGGLANAKKKPKVRVAKKIFFSTERIKDISYKALVRKFASAKPELEIKRNKDKKWEVTMVAFFRKESYHGPITIWLYDKDDKKSIKAKDPINAISVDQKSPKKHFLYDLLIDGNLGFNKNHSYLLIVGQILGKKHKVYAKGVVHLKP